MNRLILMMISILLISSAWALDLNAPIPVDPTLKIGKLNNGLTYYLKQNKVPEKKAELRLVVNAGSILEDDYQTGLAHFTEHMAFNGTKNFKKTEMTDYLASIGAGFAGGLNAYTSYDETVYMLTSATDNKEQLKKAVFILSEWADKVSFDDDEIERERGVIIEEWRGGRGADERIRNKQLAETMYDSKYSKRMPIGNYEILSTFKPEAIKQFYKDWYRPDLQAVVIVGDIDINEVESYIKEYFNTIPTRSNPRERVYESVPDFPETRVSIIGDKEANASSVSLSFKADKEDVKTIADYRKQLINNIFYDLFNYRLSEIASKENPPFIYAYTYRYGIARTKDDISIVAGVKDNGIQKGLESLAIEKERIDKYGFTQSEFDRIVTKTLNDYEDNKLEKGKQDSGRMIWAYVRHYLSGNTIMDPEQSYNLVQQLLPTITLNDVNLLIKNYSQDTNRIISASYPEKEMIIPPTKEELLAILDKTNKMDVEPYLDNVVNEPLIAQMPKPGKVKSKKFNKKADLTELTLSNGIKVIYKKTDFKNNEILFDSFSPGGVSKVKTEDIANANILSPYLNEAGFGSYDQSSLSKLLTGKNAETRIRVEESFESINGSCSSKDLELAMQLIYSAFTQVRKDTAAYNNLVAQMENYFNNRSQEPESVFEDSMFVSTYMPHPRLQLFDIKSIEQSSLDKIYQIYQDRFADASDFTFIFIGAINDEEFESLCEKYLASLPNLNRNEKIEDHKIEYAKGIVERKIYAGMEEKSIINISIPSKYSYNPKENTEFGAMILILNEKLRENIREKMSGVYYIYAYPDIKKYPKETVMINIALGCSPARVDELTQAIYAEIDLIKTELVDEKYLQIYLQTSMNNWNASIKKNNFWLSSLKSCYQNNVSVEDFLNKTDYYQKVTAKDVLKMAQKYLNYNENRISGALYPQQKQ